MALKFEQLHERTWFKADSLVTQNTFTSKKPSKNFDAPSSWSKERLSFNEAPTTCQWNPPKGSLESRFQFYCIVVECEQKNANQIWDLCHEWLDPVECKIMYPLAGQYLFVPFRESESWPTALVVELAKGCTKILNSIKPFYLNGAKDLCAPLENPYIVSIHQGLLTWNSNGKPLIYSAHTTNRDNVIAVLVKITDSIEATRQLNTLHDLLHKQLSEED